ncbi:MAG TPA: glycoside hydrolase family 15 protein, partial [Terracidiphilus sp.]
RVWFTLTYGESYLVDPKRIDPMRALEDTQRYWERWSAKLKYEGEYREAVERSLITLKALTYRPTGGIVAAVTTSLPEQLGGQRNWDYRYCWLRDTTFTLLALVNAGYYDEAVAWQDWLLRALAGSPDQVQIMYGIQGDRQLIEWELDWLPGYEKSTPVRIGNAASNQVQLDIYGEMLDSFFHSQSKMGRHTEDDFRVLSLLLDHLEKVWDQPDSGIWEMRGGAKQFTYSKMMCWVAFDRAVLLADQLKYDAPVERWKKIRDAIHKQVCDRGFSKKKNAFVQEYGSEGLDASLLLMPSVGFLHGKDPRVKGTIEAIERELMRDGLLLRYDSDKTHDGLPPKEGAFLACSFWMVSSLKAIGRPDDAHALFEKLLALRNDLGLLSEEYDVHENRFVGNYPQAFSHIALVNAAFDLARREESHHRAERQVHSAA